MTGYAVWNIETEGYVLALTDDGQYYVKVYVNEQTAKDWCAQFNDDAEFYVVREVSITAIPVQVESEKVKQEVIL